MARELIILRHGKAANDEPVSDYNRALKNRGKRDAQRMGVWLWQNELRPDCILSSPAQRAITTAQKCCKSMGFSDRDIIRDRRIYNAQLDTLLTVLGDVPDTCNRVMLVGHNPGLEDLLSYLTANIQHITLAPADMAYLSIPGSWHELTAGCATLKQQMKARELPKGFPYPAPYGMELRDRPAYYYTQSAVIPFRESSQGTEFLVISSSKKNHWVVPKGIQDPGLTAQESAAKEAYEEAGIRGEVLDSSLGRYIVEKWGATCEVDVYPMRVNEVIDTDEWEESHRERQWLSADFAAARLKSPELGRMLLQLAGRLDH